VWVCVCACVCVCVCVCVFVCVCVSEEPYGQNGGPLSPFEMKRPSDPLASSQGRGDSRALVPEFRPTSPHLAAMHGLNDLSLIENL
jgi:hypothetical protein